MRVNQPFIPLIHHIWGESVLRGIVFITQTSERMKYFTILQYKLHSFNIQEDRRTRGLLAKPFKKFPKSPIRPAGYHFCSARCGRVFEWTLIELRSNIIRIYYVYFSFNNIYEKILDCDRLREMQFLGNTVQKKVI